MDGQHDEVIIGDLGRPHGVVGLLHAYPTGPTLPGLAAGEQVSARLRDGSRRNLTLAEVLQRADGLLLRFREADSREAAAALVGGVLTVAERRLAPLADDDEFFVRDLIGYGVVLVPGGEPLGAVTQVFPGAANDSLEVRDGEGAGEPALVPFTHDAIVRVDRPARTLHVRADLFGGGQA